MVILDIYKISWSKMSWCEASLSHMSKSFHLLFFMSMLPIFSAMMRSFHIFKAKSSSKESLNLGIIMIIMNHIVSPALPSLSISSSSSRTA